jgi:protein-L-isoaspartate(D-aspartate) O-methyltransferase
VIQHNLRPTHLVAAARDAGVRDEQVLDAIRSVPRASFVPAPQVGRAYADRPVAIPHDLVTTQPSLVARMIEALALTGTERVLEVGTGYGWQTALLASLAKHVWSVERWPDLAATAQRNLARQDITNVEVVVGDGSEGLREQAPFDAIIVSAAYPRVPAPLAEQLAAGGRLVQPIGRGGNEEVILFEHREGALRARRRLTGAHFVPLIRAHGGAAERDARAD